MFGKPAHSANPEKGINAVYKICGIIEEIRKLKLTHHAVLGDGILELTDIKSSPYPGASVVPEYVSATYDRRLLVGETLESVLQPLQELIDNMMKKEAVAVIETTTAPFYLAMAKQTLYNVRELQRHRGPTDPHKESAPWAESARGKATHPLAAANPRRFPR